MLHHCSFYWSSVKSFLANCFFNHWWPLSFALLQHSPMPADNQLGGHGDMWSHCFPEGIVNAASPNHLWFQCLGQDAYLQINSNGSKLIQNWNCPIFLQVMFFLYLLPYRKYEYKRDNVCKGIRGNSHAVRFHTAPPTRHGQNHHQSAMIHYSAPTNNCFHCRFLKETKVFLSVFLKNSAHKLLMYCVKKTCFVSECHLPRAAMLVHASVGVNDKNTECH